MSIKLRTASDGLVILQPEDTASEVTVTVPAGTDTLLNTASDIEAQVKTATNATGDAPIYACRAWVNFNGTGTVAIRASGNVSSITDNGTGIYTVNFTTAMPDANYTVSGSMTGAGGTGNTVGIKAASAGSVPTDMSTTSVRIFTAGNAAADPNVATVEIIR